nr:hypothetical protein [Gordonia sihwensis]
MEPDGLVPYRPVRGRPRQASGAWVCDRCGRSTTRTQAHWPEGRICFTCWFTAIHTHGTCPVCGVERLLPGPPLPDGTPVCGPCAGIVDDFRCSRCGEESGHHRGTICARCAVRDDLHEIMGGPPSDPILSGLVDALCAAKRPESTMIWKRSPKVQELLKGLGTGAIAATHEGLDALPSRAAEHLRTLMEYHGLLPPRDRWLPRFEQWIDDKLIDLPTEVARPARHFATWHHLRRIRAIADAGGDTQPSVRSAKQEITETVKFLSWLRSTYGRTIETCTQHDVDQWIATGPTTRYTIRTFLVICKQDRLNTAVQLGHRAPKTTPSLTQDQRIAWISELLTGDSETLPYRVAGVLILLYAQPLKSIVRLQTSSIIDGNPMAITFGKHPVDVPEPFAQLIRDVLAHRTNLRTSGHGNPWLFPGTHAGDHLHPDTIMHRLRLIGMSNLGARNSALDDLVLECPPSVVADALGYSHQVAFLHAERSGETWARYAGRRLR